MKNADPGSLGSSGSRGSSLDLHRIAATCACFQLRRAARVVTQRFDAELGKAGVKATQFTILTAAKLAGAVTVNELAELVVLEQSSLSRNLAVMVRKGWLELHPGTDRRVRVVRLTAKGMRTLERAWPHWLAAQSAIERHFSSQGLQNGLGFLDQMTRNFRERDR